MPLPNATPSTSGDKRPQLFVFGSVFLTRASSRTRALLFQIRTIDFPWHCRGPLHPIVASQWFYLLENLRPPDRPFGNVDSHAEAAYYHTFRFV